MGPLPCQPVGIPWKSGRISQKEDKGLTIVIFKINCAIANNHFCNSENNVWKLQGYFSESSVEKNGFIGVHQS